MQRFTTEGLRHHNRALVLRRLREVGEITHGDLAGATGLAAGTVSVILNELNRSMGVDDAYPFVLSDVVIDKLTFVQRRVSSMQPAAAVSADR